MWPLRKAPADTSQDGLAVPGARHHSFSLGSIVNNPEAEKEPHVEGYGWCHLSPVLANKMEMPSNLGSRTSGSSHNSVLNQVVHQQEAAGSSHKTPGLGSPPDDPSLLIPTTSVPHVSLRRQKETRFSNKRFPRTN